mmetsp:Transcript_8204/g.14854  ORF Transcript_8204/g.14854 Transcript_8204/m.14854 type:complete len:113 (-) Transcript_8204:158-496(-)
MAKFNMLVRVTRVGGGLVPLLRLSKTDRTVHSHTHSTTPTTWKLMALTRGASVATHAKGHGSATKWLSIILEFTRLFFIPILYQVCDFYCNPVLISLAHPTHSIHTGLFPPV